MPLYFTSYQQRGAYVMLFGIRFHFVSVKIFWLNYFNELLGHISFIYLSLMN